MTSAVASVTESASIAMEEGKSGEVSPLLLRHVQSIEQSVKNMERMMAAKNAAPRA